MKEHLTRIFIIVIVVLFVLTGLGVGVVGFWQATHPPKDNATQQPKSSTCELGTESNVEKLPPPEVYKPPQKIEKLEVTDLQEGNGKAVAAGDCLVMKYQGSLATDGKVFEQNFDKSEAIKLEIGTGKVIKGWDQGIVGMKVGGTRRLVIPAELAYGSQGSEAIPANSDLVFVVKLESIK